MVADKPHIKRQQGFPLNTLSVEIKSGKYYYDLQKNKYKNYLGFKDFLERF